MIRTENLFDFSHSLAGSYLRGYEYPWQALTGISDLILALGSGLGDDYTEVSPQVWVHKTATVAPTAFGKPRCSSRGRPGFRGTLWVASRVPSALSTSNS